MTGIETVRVREATPPDRPAVLNVLDGSGLRTDIDALTEALAREAVLVAVVGSDATGDHRETHDSDHGERLLGTLVLDGREIRAVAVRRRRRDQGIGTALVEAAARRRDRLEAEFDPRVRPFWERLGFDVSRVADDRFRGVL